MVCALAIGLGASAPARAEIDTDGDGLPDDYEAPHPCLSPLTDDRFTDDDLDGLAADAEFFFGTDPCNADTDGDGVSDLTEIVAGVGPPTPPPPTDGGGRRAAAAGRVHRSR